MSDIATEAHTRIQQDFEHINPVIGVNQNMRSHGYPADIMTIDCLKTGKRIVLLLHDEQPDTLSFQFSFRETESAAEFERIPFDQVDSQQLYEWMSGYFGNRDEKG